MENSLFWQIPLGLALLSLAWLLASIGNGIRSAMKSIGDLTDDLDITVKEVNATLPAILENVNGIIVSIRRASETEIEPILHNVQEISEVVNRNVVKIDELIDLIDEVLRNTIGKAEQYRDLVLSPISELVSFWNGIKVGFASLRTKK